jgi:hypothetical protein
MLLNIQNCELNEHLFIIQYLVPDRIFWRGNKNETRPNAKNRTVKAFWELRLESRRELAVTKVVIRLPTAQGGIFIDIVMWANLVTVHWSWAWFRKMFESS